MCRVDSVFTATTRAAQRKGWNRFRRTILSQRPPRQFPPWSQPKARKSACALWPSRICKARFRSGISTVIPNCSRMATPEARLLQHRRAIAMASNGRTTTRPWNIWLLILTLRTPRALFTAIDPDDAAPGSPGGKWVPEAVGLVISSGVTVHDYKSFWGVCACATLARAI